MNDVDDEESASDSGYTTPPLSPSKTASTEGWLSPTSPVSPRKVRSCLFFRDAGEDGLLPTPPDTPTKVKGPSRFSALPLQDIPDLSPDLASPPSSDDSPIKRRMKYLNSVSFRPFTSSRLNYRSLPDAGRHPRQLSDGSNNHASSEHTSLADLHEGNACDIPSILTTERHISPPQTPVTVASNSDSDGPGRIKTPNISDIATSSARLSRLPLRYASSPLRPSQWATRGGLLSPPRHQAHTPDRFIGSRRPPNVSRDSFELNRPSERLEAGSSSPADPFGRRLRRSGRLNEELRSLRETHSVLTGRAYVNRRGGNPAIRRGSVTLGTRQISAGAVWHVGGSSAFNDTVLGVPNGSGGMLGSGTNAPLYTSMFLSRSDPEAELEAYERRLALALGIDQTDRILEHSFPANSSSPANSQSTPSPESHTRHVWRDNAWTKDVVGALLDAPLLRDDYYCSLLAYSHTTKCLAVGLGNYVHLWSEKKGVDTPDSVNTLSTPVLGDVQHVTSLAFSSTQGGQAILAVGRADGRITLWSPLDSEPRFDATQPKPISCVAFRPTTVKRPSRRDRCLIVCTEELLIGDEAGHVYFYSIEWPSEIESALFGWNGAMTLLARMTIHTQQVCGLSWSIDGELFASGGNDNACFLFETKKILQNSINNTTTDSASTVDVRYGTHGESIYTVTLGHGTVINVPCTQAKHKWELNAAIKAIAFCPWQRGLVAVGGGSNDRCIHFYHTISGACLATIDCAAQITSLIWSQTRREIAATFGFAQPEHPYRIAVFAWPSCEQIVAIPWYDENRALYAVAYPGSADPAASTVTGGSGRTTGEDGVWWKRSVEEGCIVVAASDAAIRFHEIWAGGKKGIGSGPGQLGGSEILESLHGIEREDGAVIR
ncbi:WD40 repeat-like protein [Byssothecium circinans]|uniref:WD40 repeat-like protein n=1 Tax=Byssothecium circinans TaxID=147558 RepID=A0A6A5UH79_9PLEO|nr:WD40 repeat-like protein [Byssothecium circinans]